MARYSYPCFLVGTIAVDCGMFLCARIIERATLERFYKPKEGVEGDIFWLQPGGQKVGDQVFNSFAGSLNSGERLRGKNYVKSIKNPQGPRASTLWLAVGVTMSGFVLQFIGARGLHASVTVSWLGSTLLMAILRASLRASRMSDADNLMAQPKLHQLPRTVSYGYELDWLSIFLKDKSEDRGFHLITNPAERATYDVLSMQRRSIRSGLGRKILKTRARLAVLTGPGHLSWESFPVRDTAKQLKDAIEGIMELLRTVPNKLNLKTVIQWPIYISCSKTGSVGDDIVVETHLISLSRKNIDAKWQLDQSTLEAILGLWTWSLVRQRSSRLLDLDDEYEQVQYRILCSTSFDSNLQYPEIARWIATADMTWIIRTKADQSKSFLTELERYCFKGALLEKVPDDKRGSIFDLCVKSEDTILKMTSHDIFASFMSNALGRGLDMTLNKAFDDATYFLPQPVSYLLHLKESYSIQNPLLESWVQRFEESGLGSRDEAFLCILPALYERPKASRVHGGLKLVRERIEDIKREDNYDKAIGMWLFLSHLGRYEQLDARAKRRTLVELIGLLGTNWTKGVLPDHMILDEENAKTELQLLVGLVGQELFEVLMKCSWNRVAEAFQHELSNGDVPQHQEELILLRRVVTNRDKAHHMMEYSNDLRLTLSWAVKHEQSLLFLLLLDKGDSVDYADSSGKTHLMWASECGHVGVVDWLLTEGAEVDACRPKGPTSLLLAARGMHWEVVEKLVISSADMSARDFMGITALMMAAETGPVSVLEVMVDHGADLEELDESFETALIHAAKVSKNKEVVAFLIKRGALVDATSWVHGVTALMYAAESGNLPAIEALLNGGANYKLLSPDGKSALDIAEKHGKQEAHEMIAEWIAEQSGGL